MSPVANRRRSPKPARSAERRRKHAVPHTGRGRGETTPGRIGWVWLLVLMSVAVAAASAVTITALQRHAAQRNEMRILLAKIETSAWQQSTLNAQALMARAISPSVTQMRTEIDNTVDAIGGQFDRLDPGNTPAQAVQEAFLVYDTAADREFTLLGQGELLAAQRAAEWQTEPAFRALITALNDADQHYEMLSKQAGSRARVGTTLTVGLAGLAVGVLVWQSHRVRSRAVRRARHQASHDILTGLPNRGLLHERIDAVIGGAEHAGAALLLIDLDRFKEINDTLGHRFGDRLLIEVADRLRAEVRAGETLARLGGDEYAVLLPSVTSEQDVAAVAGRLRQALEAPLQLDGLGLTVAGSIGAALWPQHGDTAGELLQRADIAMYAAKSTRQGYALYDSSQDATDPRKLILAGDLRRGIEQNQLVLHYQPKVDARTAAVLGVEALVRWQHPEHGMIAPDEFIPLAEHTGLITPLTAFVLDTALRQCRTWLLAGHELTVAVNVSAHRLLDEALPDEVDSLLARWDVPARLLTLEITESTIMADPERARRVLDQLHTLGVQLSIDDFGTGYSSMAYLKNLPVQELKIDRSFVSPMTTSDRDAVIVRSTVELGRNLGLRVVAEGVEDLATWRQLDTVGCDVLQGYYISRPIPADGFDQWFKNRTIAAVGTPA